ncbi:MAG: hypothetical protein Q4Q37_10070 [Methanobrevibacter sp.]|nr:hypothetical protein [Methanobrevibacter sp.]
MDEWHIGDPVDWGDGWMDAQNWGRGGDDEDDNYDSGSYGGSSSYGGSRPHADPEKLKRFRLNSKKEAYERYLKLARNQTDDEYRIRDYCEALECANEYFAESERLGITIEGMPDRNHLLSEDDVDWISKKHYDEFYKLHILSTDQTENLERLLKESSNGNRIVINNNIRRQKSIEAAKRRSIEHVKHLKEDYFKRIEKANELALKNKPHKAIKEYQNAIDAYEEFFQSCYATDDMKREMPDKSLTTGDVDNIMTIYKKTHPLLTSNKANVKTNRKILDMLEGDWDDRLDEADRQVAQILELKNLKRLKRKQEVENIAVDVIVGARILGDSILNRFKDW